MQFPKRAAEEAQLPFLLELKRPHKQRLERQFKGQAAIQIDGAKGWKLRPFLRRRDVEPYTPEQLKAASLESESDGRFVDCAYKDIQVMSKE